MTTSDSTAGPRPIELLAPARNLACGLAAIEHGADAVYIGAEHFGARAAAGNSVADIGVLCRRAHVFGARVYATLNTIVYEDELQRARELMGSLADAGVDAFLVQDMGYLPSADSPLGAASRGHAPVPLHASTQTDNRTAEKVKWLRDRGFSRVVLARELSASEIAAIHEAVPDVELEVFVHGALCVSYSGLCYASQYCFGRSANRGECAQLCRMKYSLKDHAGRTLGRERYWLSLKDLCQADALEELLLAGASSLKIEGRLKDEVYVKNVVAAYSERLNSIIARHPDRYKRASRGRCTYGFTPNLSKTFNRGFTHYFLHGRVADMASPDTPKAMGEFVGNVKWMERENGRAAITVAGTASFGNGDGLCFINEERQLEGFRVNSARGNRLYPLRMPRGLKPGMALYRNNDQEFERLLSGHSAERKMDVTMVLEATGDGFCLTMLDAESGAAWGKAETRFEHQEAKKPQHDNMVNQLKRLGGTPFACSEVVVKGQADRYFLPSSLLSELRQRVVAASLDGTRLSAGSGLGRQQPAAASHDSQLSSWSALYNRPYLFNIANSRARAFYEKEGLKDMAPAFELAGGGREPLLMQCRYCIRFALGHCVRHGGRAPQWEEPLFLELADGRQFRLEFDCKNCQMNVYGTAKGGKDK